MRRMTGFGLGLALVAVALAACMPSQTSGAGDAAAALAGTSWRLTELNRQSPVPGIIPPTLVFDASGDRASGNGGCNQFNGPYTQTEASLRFGALASTRRACTDAAGNAQETAYLQALGSTTRFTTDRGTLVLYDGTQAIARFQSTGA